MLVAWVGMVVMQVAVKPIALHLLSQVAIDPEVNLPISESAELVIGGCLEFILLGASSVQAACCNASWISYY